MRTLAFLTCVLLFAIQGFAKIPQDESTDLEFSIKFVPLAIWQFNLPDELETVPQMYNHTLVSDSQFTTAEMGPVIFTSIDPSMGLKMLNSLRLSYTLHGCLAWAGGGQERYDEGMGSESYVYTGVGEWFLMHELALDVTVYHSSDFDVDIGLSYTTTDLEFERGWYRYSKYDEYATAKGDVEIYSGKIRWDMYKDKKDRSMGFYELSFDYGKIDFPEVEDGDLFGLRFAVGGYIFNWN